MENNEILLAPHKPLAVNADSILCRASQASKLFVEPKSKTAKDAGELSETTKTLCLEMYMHARYGRTPEEIKNKYLDKGNEREEDSITLVSRVLGKMYKKNTTRLYNSFVSGEVDTYLGESIKKAEIIIDTKSCWSLLTFLKAKEEMLEPAYRYQGHCYMDLTGAKQHIVARCLVNGTAQSIIDEKRKLAWKMGIIDMDATDNEDFFEKCRQIEINHIFDMFSFKEENPHFDFHNNLSDWHFDIPMVDRLYAVTIDRDDTEIGLIHAGVTKARNYINRHLFKI